MCTSFAGDKKARALDARDYLDQPAGTMLADYYERAVGTPEEQGYDELVLYTRSVSHALLEHYTDGGTECETLTSYLVPIGAVQAVYDAITACGMDRWSGRGDLVALCGKLYVCKFPCGGDSFVRVSSEAMPPDGDSAFGAVRSAFGRYLKEEYRIV